MSIRVHDTVWKAVLEDFADDFLRRIFVNADAAFDFSIPIEFLEQELVELQPGAEPEVPKIVDKLLKVHLNDFCVSKTHT